MSTTKFKTIEKNRRKLKTEEGRLEPTPPLKRIYTRPSIKVLLPLNQCKSSFCKFTINSIKTYTSQCNKNMIHNFSDHKLTEDELLVLTKGLSFVAIPTKTFKQETYKSWNKFKTGIPPSFKRMSSWTLPPSEKPFLTKFLRPLNKTSSPSTPCVGKPTVT